MTAEAIDSTKLSALGEAERYERFDQLQRRMPGVWNIMGLNQEGESVVVIPSIVLEGELEGSGSMTQAYEERYLFMLLLLREPRLRMIYVTSMPVAPAIVEYYLALLPGVIPSHARARLSLVAVNDSSPRALSEKLLARPRLLGQIAALIPDTSRSHLVPYDTTTRERDLALALGIPMFGADPRLFELGTKSGCRRLFAEEGVRHPLGFEDLHTLDDLLEATMRLRAARPTLTELIVKLNVGVSGAGNAMVDLIGLPDPGSPGEREAVAGRLRAMRFEQPDTPFGAYIEKLAARGGIVEERITGVELRSPSVQLRVTPLGEVEVLSTHDQLLGGPSGQSFLGARLPADAAYAIELNLRKGGTTHPFLTLQFLTEGSYDPDTGVFLTPAGLEKYLVATDHLASPTLRGLSLDDLFDIVARHGLHFDQARQSGVIFHMISCLTEHGRIGLTAVGDTADQADATYRRAERILLEEADAALKEPALPA
jgi:hypothetical protein